MNITNLKNCADLHEIKATVCVVGSGPAGGVLAAQLAKKNIDVVLLEAGTELPNYSSESIADTNFFSDASDLRFGWSRQFGGSSNLWAGRTCPLEKVDFEKRDWVPESGLPFALDTLTPYYKQGAEILDIPGYHYFDDQEGLPKEASVFSSAAGIKTGL